MGDRRNELNLIGSKKKFSKLEGLEIDHLPQLWIDFQEQNKHSTRIRCFIIFTCVLIRDIEFILSFINESIAKKISSQKIYWDKIRWIFDSFKDIIFTCVLIRDIEFILSFINESIAKKISSQKIYWDKIRWIFDSFKDRHTNHMEEFILTLWSDFPMLVFQKMMIFLHNPVVETHL